ncbi:hypothetical protein EJ110_NYTH12119 [Nymphaea thermarum]|nr:hypothetical protein EJ110_NYTH12119 [Nymphaea thermarum]
MSSSGFSFPMFFFFFFFVAAAPPLLVKGARISTSVSSLLPETLYNSIFLHKDDNACPAKNFYPYSAFIQAANSFPKFGNTGTIEIRKREIAAFLAQISHETTGK